MSDRVGLSIAHDNISRAFENRLDESADRLPRILIVGVGVHHQVGAEAQRGVQTGHVGGRQTTVSREADDMMHPHFGRDDGSPVGAAVVDDQHLDAVDAVERSREVRERLPEVVALVEAGDLYDELHGGRRGVLYHSQVAPSCSCRTQAGPAAIEDDGPGGSRKHGALMWGRSCGDTACEARMLAAVLVAHAGHWAACGSIGSCMARQATSPPKGVRHLRMGMILPVALAVVIVFLVHLEAWRFLCDDAYISFRYARNLAEFGELVFNVQPLERVEGYTNFLFVLILAGGQLVGVAPDVLAPWLNLAGGLAILILATRCMRAFRTSFGAERTDGSYLVQDLIPASFLALQPEFVVWSSGGLETSVGVALGLAAIAAWLSGSMKSAAAWAALAGLCRPDTLLWIAAFGLAWLLFAGLQQRFVDRRAPQGFADVPRLNAALRSFPRGRLWVASAVFVVPLITHLVWRRFYYGAWVPNTWTVKQSGMLLQATWGIAYLELWARNLHVMWLLPASLLLRGRHVLLVFPLMANLVYGWSMGGDFMAYSRFYLPATVFWALLIGWLVSDAGALLARAIRPSWMGRLQPVALVWLTMLVGLASQVSVRIAQDHVQNHIEGRWEGVQAMDRFARVRIAAGEVMAATLDPDTWVSVGAAGAMPYASRLPAYDSYGLVDPGVAKGATPAVGTRARPGHQLHGSLAYMQSRNPDLMCHVGTDWTHKPGAVDARRRGLRRWTWRCFETGDIMDPRAEAGVMQSRFYCCLTPPVSLRRAQGGGG